MKLYNPFMPWLNPRNSGLITFKGGETEGSGGEELSKLDNLLGTASETGTVNAPGGTMDIPTTSVNPETGEVTTGTNTVGFGGGSVPVTGTVKGDTETLIGGQSDISDQISTGFETFQPVNVTNTTIDTSDLAKADAMDQGFTNVLDDTGAIKTGVEGLGTDVSAIKDDTGAIKTGVEGLGTSIDEGFATTGDQLTGLGTGQTGISNQISDLSGDVSEGITTVGNNLTSGFENIDNQFASQNEDLATLSTNVLGGQASLQDYLNDMSGRADTYYEGLSGNQSQLLENLGGLQTGFTDFRDTYDSDVTLANQTRADLQDTVVGGFNRMREDMGNNFDSTQKNVNRVADQIEANQAQQALAARTPNLSLTQSIKELASGVQATTPNQADAQNQVASKLATIKQILTQSGQNIPENIRSDYTALANSFDEKGRFIPQSIDQQGNVTRRVMDEQTNLSTSIVNSRGVSLGGKNINVANLLSVLDGGQSANEPQFLQGLMSQQNPFNTTQG